MVPKSSDGAVIRPTKPHLAAGDKAAGARARRKLAFSFTGPRSALAIFQVFPPPGGRTPDKLDPIFCTTNWSKFQRRKCQATYKTLLAAGDKAAGARARRKRAFSVITGRPRRGSESARLRVRSPQFLRLPGALAKPQTNLSPLLQYMQLVRTKSSDGNVGLPTISPSIRGEMAAGARH